MAIKLRKQTSGTVTNPASTHLAFFVDETGAPKFKDDAGTVTDVYTPPSPEDLTVLKHVYISQANGSDSNDGSSGVSAMATMAAYLSQYPEPPKTGRVFHFDSGTHLMPNLPKGWGLYAPIILIGDGADQAGDDGFTETRAEEASQAGSTVYKITTTGGVSVAANVGQFVQMTSGAANGALRVIHDVIGDDIYLTSRLEGFVVGDTFRLVNPAAVFDYYTGTGDDKQDVVNGIGGGSGAFYSALPFFCMINAYLQPGVGQMVDSMIIKYGVQYEYSGNYIANSTLFSGPGFSTNSDDVKNLVPYISQISANVPQTATTLNNLWRGWGVVCLQDNFTIAHGDFRGTLTLQDNLRIKVGFDGISTSRTSSATARFTTHRGALDVRSGGTVTVNVPAGFGSCTAVMVGSSPAVYAYGGGHIEIISAGLGVYSSATAPAVQAVNGGTIILDSGSYTSSANIGIETSGGQVYTNAPTVSGSNPGVNDISVDGGATSAAYSSIPNAHDFLANGPSAIYRIP